MRKSIWTRWIGCLSTMILLFSLACFAQDKAPIPSQLRTAKKIFVSNAGADSGLFPEPFSGAPNRGYNQLYTAIQTLGRYQLVDSPEDSDLVLELRLFAPNGPANANKQKGASDPLPMFRLAIYDAKTRFTLWALTQSIDPAVLQKTHDHNFDTALTTLVYGFDNLTKPAAAAP